jgi:hypothetical protein
MKDWDSDGREDEARLARGLRGALRASDAEAPDPDEASAYVDGRLDPEARALFEARLADDELLRLEVEDLRVLRAHLAGPPRRRARPMWVVGGGLAAAAVLMLAVRTWREPPPPPGPEARGPAPTLTPAPAEAGLGLRDGARVVRLTPDGTLQGLDDVDERLRRAVAEALGAGRLPLAASARPPATGALMGPDTDARFQLRSPVGTVVRDGRPTFRWTRRPGARAYLVTVSDDRLTVVARSGELDATEWRPGAGLAPGHRYRWQVAASTADGREVVPRPDQPESWFRVLSRDESLALERDLALARGSHLASAVVLAKAGLVDEADGALRALAGDNPGQVVVEQLRASLHGPPEVRPALN